jgi:hypothetical protein
MFDTLELRVAKMNQTRWPFQHAWVCLELAQDADVEHAMWEAR